MVYLANSFSLNMLSLNGGNMLRIEIEKIDKDKAALLLKESGFVSAVGHADLAALITGQLGFPVPVDRKSITLKESDILVVAQYVGPRLPEGATTLPEGAKIEFFIVRII